jgi:glycosyltransferase involved in cell wall biosynthesis
MPKVSICVQAYQHYKYLKDCIDGLLTQKTNFEYEILLGEDDSHDGTRDLCIEYAKKYPHKIRLFLHSRKNNVKIAGTPTGRFNLIYNFSQSQGDYIALCEADDYWTDPLKLQKQIDFLENEKNCSVNFTSALYHFENNPNKNFIYKPFGVGDSKIFKLQDAIQKGGEFMPTASIVFRAEYLNTLPYWLFKSPVGDLPLSLFLGTKGNYGYLSDTTCVYRKMVSGSWSEQMTFQKRLAQVEGFLQVLSDFDDFTNQKFSFFVKKQMNQILLKQRVATIKRMFAKFIPVSLVKVLAPRLLRRLEYFKG